MNTFQKEITFLSKILNGDQWEEGPVTKTATFKELKRTDRGQHKLHFRIIAIFEAFAEKKEDQVDGEGSKVKLDSDALYDLTVKAVKTLIIEDNEFTVQDRNEFLNDSGALLNFGLWLLGDKIAPFFSKFKDGTTK